MKRAVSPLAAMFIGGLIYVLWRSDNLLVSHWFAMLGAGRLVATLRAAAAPYAHSFPPWVYYSLPQALWLYSGLRAFHLIWGGSHPRALNLWSSTFAAFAFGSELGQRLGLVPGRFDWLDLGLLIAAFLAASFSNFGIITISGRSSDETSLLARSRGILHRAVNARYFGIWQWRRQNR